MADLHEVESTILSEGRHAGEFIMSEANGNRSRAEVTLIANQAAALEAGTVLGIITASGKWTEMLPGAATGEEASAGILLNNTPLSTSDQAVTVILRDAEVNGNELEWEPSGTIQAGELVTGKAELAALGVIVRE